MNFFSKYFLLVVSFYNCWRIFVEESYQKRKSVMTALEKRGIKEALERIEKASLTLYTEKEEKKMKQDVANLLGDAKDWLKDVIKA